MKMFVLVLFLLSIASSFPPFDAPDLIFPPLLSTMHYGNERAIVFIPGGGVPIGFYNKTIIAFQQATRAKLWVGVPNFANTVNLCNPLDGGPWGVKKKVEGVINQLNSASKRTFENKDIFIFGHSLGSSCAQIYFNKGYAGFGLFGGCASLEVGFNNVAEPMICFTGELDRGMIPTIYSYVLQEIEQHIAAHGLDETLEWHTVAAADHMCHLDFSPGYENASHFRSELPQKEALQIIGTVIAGFLHVQLEGAATNSGKDFQVLKQYYNTAQTLLSPYRQAAKMQNTTWCGQYAFHTMTHPSIAEWGKLKNVDHFLTSDVPGTFEHEHPNITENTDGTFTYYTSSMAEYPLGRSYEVWYGLVISPSSATDVACKLPSRDLLGKKLGLDWSIDKTCKDVNQEAINVATSLLEKTNAITRFQKIGKQFKLLDDSISLIGPQWVWTKLSFSEKDDHVEVQSTALPSPLSSHFYPGNHYCKLLSPARVIEWMMAWGLPTSLKKSTVSKYSSDSTRILKR